MVAIPWQRPSPDLRTVLLVPVHDVTDAIAHARSRGWSVVEATHVHGGVAITFGR